MSNDSVSAVPDWTDVRRALVIVAHPDDADFICAGACIQMVKQGIEVTYMVLTNGDKGNHNPEITRNQLIAMRKIEQRKAAALCGVKEVLFMGEEDGFLRPRRTIRVALWSGDGPPAIERVAASGAPGWGLAAAP